MKHLKRYSAMHSLLGQQSNESYTIRSLQTVSDFCVNHLAYLLDDDSYQIDVQQKFGSIWHGTSPSYIFSLHKLYNGALDIINWEEVKDNIIPFLHMLIREYNIEEVDKVSYRSTSNYDELSPMDRTTYFYEYIPKEYNTGQHYMNVNDVITDQEVPEKFYRMTVKFY